MHSVDLATDDQHSVGPTTDGKHSVGLTTHDNHRVDQTTDDMTTLRTELERLETRLHSAETVNREVYASLHPGQREAARNLFGYLCLRSEDLRDMQVRLHNAGLSSLASSESHILRQVESILERLGKVYPPDKLSIRNYAFSRESIGRRSALLFGAKQDAVIPYLMITFDAAFAEDHAFISTLLLHGMNVARINCAHDDAATWKKMIGSIRQATEATGLTCNIYMDLAGPKIRSVIRGKGKSHGKEKDHEKKNHEMKNHENEKNDETERNHEKVKNHGKMKIAEGEELILAEEGADLHRKGLPKKDLHKKEKVIGCSLAGIVRHLEKGHRVLIDDGVIEAVVEEPGEERARLRITRVSAEKHTLKAEKGMNFPDTVFVVPALTDYDRECLPFIREYADIVGYSFVEDEAALAELQGLLSAGEGREPFIVLKIERAAAVKNLPGLLLQGMRKEAFGIMIARGDLAVEIGFERLSEIQEEILWLSEAAHVPVIWATQVLETLNKTGLATRSEVTDAAYAAQSECVMINKGEHLLKVIDVLKDILLRSGGHHLKKRYTFRPLSIARNFMHPDE